MLEELGWPYEVHPIDITEGDQFEEEFLRISPNNKIPAIVDPDGPGGAPYALAESGAILMYLADRSGQFLNRDEGNYYQTLQWLMFQMGHLGPMAGQAHHFINYAPESVDYAVKRYTNEVRRIYNVMDRRLGEVDYLAGDYSIADMACWPWAMGWERQGQDIAEFPNMKAWLDRVGARPAVQKGRALGQDRKTDLSSDKEAQKVLFGQRRRSA
jgi:GST-like protein